MQSRVESIIESGLNVGSGFIVALFVWQFVVTPLFGIRTSVAENVSITLIFTVVSVVRGYIWRRYFNLRALRKNKNNKETFHEATRHHR